MIKITDFLFFIGLISFLSCKDVSPISGLFHKKEKIISRDTVIEEVDTYIRRRMDSCNCPGAAITIITNGNTRLLKGYGKRSIHGSEKIDSHSVFRLASVSKNFGGLLMTLMMSKGLLHQNDKVIEYIPEFGVKPSVYTPSIEIQHILSHSSGLPYHSYTNLIESGKTLDEIIPMFNDVEVKLPAGVEYAYQNASFALLEIILRKITGKTFDYLLKQQICDSLGMCDLSFSYDSIVTNANHALPHEYHEECSCYVTDNISTKYYNVISAGGINASILDMNAWLHALMGYRPDIIPRSVLDTFFTPRIFTSYDRRHYNTWPEVKDTYYAYGMRLLDCGDRFIYYHGGYANNFRSELAIDPKYKIGMVALVNSTCCLADNIVPEVFEILKKEIIKQNLPADTIK